MKKFVRFLLVTAGLLVIAAVAFVRPDIPLDELATRYGFTGSGYIVVADTRIHYVSTGRSDARTIVLLHGSNGSSHNWGGWIDLLANDYHVVAIDLPGHGLSENSPDGDYSVERYITVITRVLDAAGVQRLTLAGNSMGGAIALHYALEYPARIAAVVLIDSAGYASDTGGPESWVFRLARIPYVRDALTLITPRFIVSSVAASAYGDPDRLTSETIDRYHAIIRGAGHRQAFLDRMDGPGIESLEGRIGDVSQPTLIVWGGRDSWIPPSTAFRFQSDIRNATLAIFDDLGHVPMEEDPEGTVDTLRTFLTVLDWR